MNTVSKSHFARMCGVSPTAISKADKAGIIGTHEGQVNLAHRLTKEYLRDKQSKLDETGKPGRARNVKEKTVRADRQKTTPKTEEKQDQELKVVRSLDDVNESNILTLEKRDLDKFKVFEQALETRLKREERRGLLIPRSMVRLVMAKKYSIDVNQIKTMEDRLTPDICGIFGMGDNGPEAVAVRKLINDDTSKFLRQVKRLIDDFLKKVDAEKI